MAAGDVLPLSTEPKNTMVVFTFFHLIVRSRRRAPGAVIDAQVARSKHSRARQDREGEVAVVHVAIFARLQAKPGKEAEVENLLRGVLSIAAKEPGTTAWIAFRLGPSTFGIFDAFPDEASREAHLAGGVPAAVMARASELLEGPPSVEKVDVLAAKLPE